MTGRLVSNPLVSIKKLPEEIDRRHERRAMTGDEFTKLFEAAYNSKRKVQGIDGPTRATIYMVASLTGLRRKELASLTQADFRLNDPMPTVRIQGAYSKNKKSDEIPLHPAVVERLHAYFERTQPEEGQPVFPLRAPGGGLQATSKMMKSDLEAAGIEYAGDDGFADFHANITSLCRSNVGIVTAQKLARHSDPKLTANIYSKISAEDRSEAVNGIVVDERARLSSTISRTTETAFGDNSGQLLTDESEIIDKDDPPEEREKPYKTRLLAQKKPVVATTGLVDRGGLEPPTPGFSVKEPTTLKPRENKAFPDSPDYDGRSPGSKPGEPLTQIASDELLADLVEGAEDALLSRLEPGLRFVVQNWPALPEGGQRAILAIVRSLLCQSGDDEVIFRTLKRDVGKLILLF